MKSMTGFGVAKYSSPKFDLEITLRSVNGRFFDPRFHIPKEYFGLESEIKSLLGKSFFRGTVDLYVGRKIKSEEEIAVNGSKAKAWLKAYKFLGKELKMDPNLTLEQIARLPDVFSSEENQGVSPAEKKILFKLLEEVSDKCVSERIREGKSLKTDIDKLLNELKGYIKDIESMRSEANESLEMRMHKRIQEKNLKFEVDQSRIAQEIIFLIDRSDINEEIQRLNEHISHFEKLMESSESQGKKMDFYTQELLREVNTIGSKSQLAPLTRLVVSAKTLVEKIKEQVQNIE